MSAPIAVLALLMASQASALPMLYNQKGACTLPTQGFGQHLAPINDTGLTFALSDASGPVAEYQPNGSYTLKVTYSAPVHIWLVTSAGAFSTQTASLGCNGATAFMGADAATSFEVTWNAPETCTPVTVSANAAKSAADNYRQATIPVSCSSGSTSNSTTPAGTPPAATTPTTPTTPSPATTPSPSPPLNGAASMVFSALAVVAALMALLM